MVAPLKKMHLYSYFGFNRNQMGIKTVMIFIAVGLFVLIIAYCYDINQLPGGKGSGEKSCGYTQA